MYEINGNLVEWSNYQTFRTEINRVYEIFVGTFGSDIMSKIDFYVDNATENSGYTPVITPVLKKFLIIKLGIGVHDGASRIVFQFAHELMHYVFYACYGLDKKFATDDEEAVCAAASLCVLAHTYPLDLQANIDHLMAYDRKGYRAGVAVAIKNNFLLENLKKHLEVYPEGLCT